MLGMMQEFLHLDVKNSRQLSLLRLPRIQFTLPIVCFFLLHGSSFALSGAAGSAREIQPIDLYERIKNITGNLHHDLESHVRRLFGGRSSAPKAVDDPSDATRRFQDSPPTLEVRNRWILDHQDAPEISISPDKNAGSVQIMEFPDDADMDDDKEERNPWVNADDYDIMIALRWTDSEDYGDAIMSPIH